MVHSKEESDSPTNTSLSGIKGTAVVVEVVDVVTGDEGSH